MNDAEFQKLLNAAPPVVLIANRKKSFLLFLASAVFVAGGVLMIRDPDKSAVIMGWAGLLFFGVGFLASFWMILVPQSYSLTLDSQGFKLKAIWREKGYAWKDVSPFVTNSPTLALTIKQMDTTSNIASMVNRTSPSLPVSSPRIAKVGVFFDDGSKSKKANFNRSLAGYSCAMSNTYGGLSGEQLATLLNHWRERALKPGGETADNTPPPAMPGNPPTDNPPHPKAPEGW